MVLAVVVCWMREQPQGAFPGVTGETHELLLKAIAICRVAVVVRVRGFVHQVGIAGFSLQGIELVHVMLGPGEEVGRLAIKVQSDRIRAECGPLQLPRWFQGRRDCTNLSKSISQTILINSVRC